MEIIKAIGGDHASTINSLAREGKIQPVEYIDHMGRTVKANSAWAMHEYMKMNGAYNDKEITLEPSTGQFGSERKKRLLNGKTEE